MPQVIEETPKAAAHADNDLTELLPKRLAHSRPLFDPDGRRCCCGVLRSALCLQRVVLA